MKLTLPRTWTAQELERDRVKAVEEFVRRRLSEGKTEYRDEYQRSVAVVEEVLRLTGDLNCLSPSSFDDRVELLKDVARFLTGPPISADDLDTLSGHASITMRNRESVRSAAAIIARAADPTRFPWVASGRPPSDAERRAAVVATASLRAVERTRTRRRADEQGRQESSVLAALCRFGFRELREARDIDASIAPGTCKRGVQFEGKQCDVIARLYDGRLLAIECKSSNSAVNSIKRLNDVFEKAEVWRRERGRKVVTAGVLSGVFDLRTLEKAQDKEVYIFWELDLEALRDFIASTK